MVVINLLIFNLKGINLLRIDFSVFKQNLIKLKIKDLMIHKQTIKREKNYLSRN